jgi:Ni/Fe-hydrogenase 1 B-type cytochrome subunit
MSTIATTDAGPAPVAYDRRSPARDELVAVYVWQIPVRIAHWVIALSIAILSVTGFYMGHPFMTVSGPATQSFVMGWVKIIHGYTAYVFIAALVMRMVWMFTGNKYAHWDKFIPVHRVRQRGLWPVTAFYSFLRDKPPAYVGHNPVAAGAYTLVYGLCLLEVATGLVLRGASSPTSWVAVFGPWAWLFGGLQMTRWIHHIVMWLLLGFTLHHIYSAVLVAIIERNGTLDSIFSGYKWVPRRDLEPGPYRRTNQRGEIDE